MEPIHASKRSPTTGSNFIKEPDPKKTKTEKEISSLLKSEEAGTQPIFKSLADRVITFIGNVDKFNPEKKIRDNENREITQEIIGKLERIGKTFLSFSTKEETTFKKQCAALVPMAEYYIDFNKKVIEEICENEFDDQFKEDMVQRFTEEQMTLFLSLLGEENLQAKDWVNLGKLLESHTLCPEEAAKEAIKSPAKGPAGQRALMIAHLFLGDYAGAFKKFLDLKNETTDDSLLLFKFFLKGNVREHASMALIMANVACEDEFDSSRVKKAKAKLEATDEKTCNVDKLDAALKIYEDNSENTLDHYADIANFLLKKYTILTLEDSVRAQEALELAFSQLTYAHSIFPPSASSLLILANIQRIKHQPDEYLKNIEKLVELHPRSSVHKGFLLTRYLEERKIEKAQAFIRSIPEMMETNESVEDPKRTKKSESVEEPWHVSMWVRYHLAVGNHERINKLIEKIGTFFESKKEEICSPFLSLQEQTESPSEPSEQTLRMRRFVKPILYAIVKDARQNKDFSMCKHVFSIVEKWKMVSSEFWNVKALAEFDQGLYDEAFKSIIEVYREEHFSPYFKLRLAFISYVAGHVEIAQNIMEDLEKTTPHWPPFWEVRGDLYMLGENFSSAKQAYEKAWSLNLSAHASKRLQLLEDKGLI